MSDPDPARNPADDSVSANPPPGPLRERWLAGVAIAALLFVWGASAGPAGVAAGLAMAGIWARWGVAYALGAGTVLLVVVVPADVDPVLAALVGVLFGALLLAAAVQQSQIPAGRVAPVAIAVPLAIGGLAWLALSWTGLWLAALVVLGALAGGSYLLHRLALVRLGLVTDTPAATPTDAPEPTTARSESDHP